MGEDENGRAGQSQAVSCQRVETVADTGFGEKKEGFAYRKL